MDGNQSDCKSTAAKDCIKGLRPMRLDMCMEGTQRQKRESMTEDRLIL